MPMTSYREPIRVAIFEAIRNSIEDVRPLIDIVAKNLAGLDKKHLEQEKLNLELTVPIKLPPGGKKGDCKAVVTLVETEFIKLSGDINGGATIQFGEGSWLDKQKNLVSDECLIVYTAMPLANWVDCISVLKKLINEVQSKLKQRCVFLRIDNQTYGDPINLLGKVADAFPGNSEFGGIDRACITLPTEEYQERPIITVNSKVTQTAIGTNNIQISSGGASNVALGPGSITSGGDIIYTGVDPIKHAEILAKNMLLEEKLNQLKQEEDEEKQKQIAEQASILAEQMRKEDNVVFTIDKLIELGGASSLAGRLELAEGQYKQALRQSKKVNDRQGEAQSLNNLGLIAYIRGDYDESKRLHNASLAIEQEIGDRKGEAQSLNNLGNIAYISGDYDEAERLHIASLAIKREIGDRLGEAQSLNNLANFAFYVKGDFDESKRLHNASLAIEREVGTRRGEAVSLHNLAVIAFKKGDDDESERLNNASLAIKQEIGDRRGVARSLNNLGIIAKARSDYEAERLYNASLAIYREIGDRRGEAQSLYYMGDVAEKRSDYDEAERLYNASLVISREIGYRRGEAESLNCLGIICKNRGGRDKAERLFAASQAIWLELGLPIEEANSERINTT